MHMAKTMRRQDKIEQGGLSRLDRLRAFYFEGMDLTDEEESYRVMLSEINVKMCAGLGKAEIAKMMAKDRGVTERYIYKLLEDSIELHGDISHYSESGYRHILTENYWRLAKIAREKGEIDIERRCLDSISKIHGLANKADGAKQPKTRQIIRRTQNARVITDEFIEESYGE